MNRREFIKKAGAVGGGIAVSAVACSPAGEASTYKLGYQLFSVRDAMAENPVGCLHALKAMGYQDFEVYGFDDQQGLFYGYEPAVFKRLLDEMDLTVTSGHYGFSPYLHKSEDELRAFVDRCIAGAKQLDSKYITWPWLDPELRTIDNFKLMARKLNLIGEQVTAAGLGFAYHNHGFEFKEEGGESGYDIILNDTDAGLVKLQMDMYWVMHSSTFTPQVLIDTQPGRFVMWHIKDMDKVTRDYTELGNGSIDYTTLLPDPVKSGLEYYYLEQGGNFAVDSMTSAAASAEYFRNKLQRLL